MDRGTPTPTPAMATPARRVRLVLSGVLALAVLAGGGLYLARGVFSSAGPPSGRAVRAAATPGASARASTGGCGTAATSPCARNPGGVAVAVSPAVVTVPPHPDGVSGTGPSSSASRSPSPAAASTRPSASATAPAPASHGGAAAAQVLALINQARAAAGLPALTITAGLEASSSAHNQRMAGGCGLSHQCPGEPAIGDRETAAGVHWSAAGENIGEGGPVADTTAAIAQMAVGITQSMLNEKPPNDGHRQNILSKTFTHIGIAVSRDSSGTAWLTQDFSN